MLPAVETSLDRPGASEARNLDGHPGHAALRSFWLSQERRRSQADIIANLRRTDRERRAALAQAAVAGKARQAWQLAVEGATYAQAAQTVGLTVDELRTQWKKLDLPSPVKARQEAR